MGIGMVMRLWDLGSRAMHHDESLHAYFAFQLSSGAGYHHDPMMHGPFQMEAMAGIFYFLGDSEFTARLLHALAGVVLIGMPFFLRKKLGTLGALVVSMMLLLSPTLLYYSRFARNDILMAVFAFSLIISMWRFLDDGRSRHLYVFAGILALAFATKETAYMISVIVGTYLLILVTIHNRQIITAEVMAGPVSPPMAFFRLIRGAWNSVKEGLGFNSPSRAAMLLVLLISLTLPLWSAALSIFQNTPLLSWSGLVLSSLEDSSAPIGSPVRGGLVIAFLMVTSMVGISVYLGIKWDWKRWAKAAALFFGITIILYSTFFTNLPGIGSGLWRSLGYWVAQQDVARGAQPLYYYLVLGAVYEFLPLVFAGGGVIFYIRRNDDLGRFLAYWTVATFLLYTIASEKMPWLLVNITLPASILAGKFLGDVIMSIEWGRLVRVGGLVLLPVVPIFMVLIWRLVFIEVNFGSVTNSINFIAVVGCTSVVIILGYFMFRRTGGVNFVAFTLIPVFLVLMVLTVKAGWNVSYENNDVPVEMLIYTQTSPDLVLLNDEIHKLDGGVTIDNASGYTWPWAWYLRDHPDKRFPSYENGLGSSVAGAVLIVHAKNRPGVDAALNDNYTEALKFKHRWWFPENYKGLSLNRFVRSLFDRQALRNVADYFLYRKLNSPLGSEDAYVYFNNELHRGLDPKSLPTFGR